jgi:hypothetical protein
MELLPAPKIRSAPIIAAKTTPTQVKTTKKDKV